MTICHGALIPLDIPGPTFCLLALPALCEASFTSGQQLQQAIDAFVAVYNLQAAPFEWTKADAQSVEPEHEYAYISKGKN